MSAWKYKHLSTGAFWHISNSLSASGRTGRRLQDALDKVHFHLRMIADDDSFICRNTPYGQVLAFPSWRLGCPAADDDFEELKLSLEASQVMNDDKITKLEVSINKMKETDRAEIENWNNKSHEAKKSYKP